MHKNAPNLFCFEERQKFEELGIISPALQKVDQYKILMVEEGNTNYKKILLQNPR